MKLLYGGNIRGLHYSPVVWVQTSDEVEPRDIIVTTSWVSSQYASSQGCKILSMTTVADGMTMDMPDSENLLLK